MRIDWDIELCTERIVLNVALVSWATALGCMLTSARIDETNIEQISLLLKSRAVRLYTAVVEFIGTAHPHRAVNISVPLVVSVVQARVPMFRIANRTTKDNGGRSPWA